MSIDTLRETILERLQQHLSPERFAHVLRVENKAIELAMHYGIDVRRCQLAALLHDLAKEWSMEVYQEVVEQYGLNKELLAYGSEILHGPVASCVIGEWFGIDDAFVQEAIAYHTIGQVHMHDVAKVLFVADYIEDGRQFDGVEMARQLAKESLDVAVTYKLQHSLAHLVKKGVRIYPETILAYNAWIERAKEK